MPKIDAPTVAEHRASRERALLDAAHALLEETGEAPSMKEVADRAGLARSSVYQYFASRTDLLNALVQDVFPKWADRVTHAMEEAGSPEASIVAYGIENVRLVHEGAHAIGNALAAVSPGAELDAQAMRMHQQIQEPLRVALYALDAPHPPAIAEMINGVVHAATRLLEAGQSIAATEESLAAVLWPLANGLANGLTGPQPGVPKS